MTILIEFGTVFLALILLALTGGFAILPFQGPYRFIATPLAGIAVHVVGVSLCYTVLQLPFAISAAVTTVAGTFVTVVALAVVRPQLNAIAAIAVAAPLVIVATVICATASLMTGGPAITFMDGTDHAGYAHMSDWLLSHNVKRLPHTSPDLPYESYPAFLVASDPRFGSFAFLASISLLRGASSLFAYDTACAVAISAVTLGIAGMFARKRTTLILLIVGLLVSHWFDYAHGGYLGKLLSYPAIIFLAGVFLNGIKNDVATPFMLMLAVGIAMLHSGIAAAVLLAVSAGSCLVIRLSFTRDWRTQLPDVARLASTGLVLVATSGVLSRPTSAPSFPDWGVRWPYVLPRILDMENQGAAVSGLSQTHLWALVALSLLIAVALLGVAITRRNADAVGLIVGPSLLLATLCALDATAVAFQLIGTFYPLTLCAAVKLIDAEDLALQRPQPVAYGLLAILIVLIGMRVPRMVGAIDRYAVKPPVAARYSASEIDRISRTIGSATVRADANTNQCGLVQLVELGRRNISVQWTERAWKLLFAYRPWPAPSHAKAPAFSLSCTPNGNFELKPWENR